MCAVVYPLAFDVKGRPVLVVGGDRQALRKARDLKRAGARVKAVWPEFAPGWGAIRRERRGFRMDDLKDPVLVFVGGVGRRLQERISRACRKRRIPVNVIDVPELCTFYAVSIVRRGPLMVAISTGGKAPGLARSLRLEIEDWISRDMGALLREVERIRRRLKREGASVDRLKKLASREVLRAWRRGGLPRARRVIQQALHDA